MRVLLNKIGSVTRNLQLHREVTLTREVVAREGAVVVGRVLTEKAVYNQLEDVHGRMPTLHAGDLVAGALGHRNALHGYEGVVPAAVAPGDTLNLLNLGGVIGRCLSHNPKVGKPFEVEILGQVLRFAEFQSRRGEPAFTTMGALEPRPVAHVTAPVVYVAGTSMNSGKTAAACALVRGFSQAGWRVGAAKLTGVSLMKDKLGMLDYGAEVAYDFTDAGCVATSPEVAAAVTRTVFAALSARGVDVIVAEMGDGILGEYGVQAILADPDLGKLHSAFVLCANDPVGVTGGVELLEREYGIRPDLVAGPATDNHVGTRFIEGAVHIPAHNAQTAAGALADHVVGLVARKRGAPAAARRNGVSAMG
jgi:hypothetical protein